MQKDDLDIIAETVPDRSIKRRLSAGAKDAITVS